MIKPLIVFAVVFCCALLGTSFANAQSATAVAVTSQNPGQLRAEAADLGIIAEAKHLEHRDEFSLTIDNDIRMTVVWDRLTNLVTVDGRDRSLNTQQIANIRAVYDHLNTQSNVAFTAKAYETRALAEVAESPAQPPAFTDEERVLLRMLEYYSQAPADYTMGRREQVVAPPANSKSRTHLMSNDKNESTDSNELMYYGEDGTQCLCPGNYETAYFTGVKGRKTTYWTWYYQVGANSCTGRCGIGCNWFDNDYMVDCFEHDLCVTHFGGSSLGDNKHCGDEFYDAADDYIVTYGAYCPCQLGIVLYWISINCFFYHSSCECDS